MNDNFYVTLTSFNRNSPFFNTPSNFKTKLAKRLSLKGEWECALCSISFPKSFVNLNKETIYFHYYDPDANLDRVFQEPVRVGKNYYQNISKLIDEINNSITKTEVKLRNTIKNLQLPRLKYQQDYNYVYLELSIYNNFYVYPEMSETLCNILGFNREELIKARKSKYNVYRLELLKNSNYKQNPSIGNEYWSKSKPELFSDYHSMFVFCDIIKDSFLSDKYLPLLRFVEIPIDSPEQVVLNFNELHYIPIRNKEFDTIKINLMDQNFKDFSLEQGRTFITLHFKKIIKTNN